MTPSFLLEKGYQLNKRMIDNNIITITEEEIRQYFGSYKDIKELREKSIKYFADNIQGQTIDIGEYKNIRINRRSREKYKSRRAYQIKKCF